MIPRISAQLSERVDSAERTMRILWIALMGSVAIYGFVMHQLSLDSAIMAADSLPLPPLVPPLVALSLAAMGTVLFRTMSAPERVRALLAVARTPQEELERAQPAHRTPAELERLQALPEAERRLNRVPAMLFTLYILRWAIYESVAVLGLVLGILSRSLEAFLPYGIAAIVLIALAPPRIKTRVIDAIPLLPADVRG